MRLRPEPSSSSSQSTLYVIVVLLAGCASTPGAKPHDMSTAQHEAAATAHQSEADPHAAAYDPNAQQAQTRCAGRGGCWTSVVNPTAEHKADAEKHRKMAADHRAAAQALRDTESQACTGISDDDRDMSPFNHREDIATVEPYEVEQQTGKVRTKKFAGAVVTFRAVPGMTAEWLQRVVDCHLARNASLGHDMPEMSYCPLVPKGVAARVTSTGNGFAVTIQSDDSATAQEVWKRAQALKPAR